MIVYYLCWCSVEVSTRVNTRQHHRSTTTTSQPGSASWPHGRGEKKRRCVSPSPKELPTRRFSPHLFFRRSLCICCWSKSRQAGSARPTQKPRPPTRKLRPVTWKADGDVAVPGQENSVGSPGEKKRSMGTGFQPAGWATTTRVLDY